ncbi:hypothetical protein CH063_12591 [Colletotrichum higginsianum]|uniref:Cytochrome P450 n=2 Tax=Colletotrichum higginsianum TaxID=80884 RepID=H1VQZ4_COLHI|nr:cytochrome P450 [Colletotrichum higginsianum IMI 349063]OBR02413.1 cytochrome P450 [Colletotrichum higginsianum IMI 349063]TID06761.1 hypothetical protein CH35J_000168 [Colletotrichum higginsianum]CCF42650.1 hypothetical protein CH063_12591 [Colletotrichum higginsianum]
MGVAQSISAEIEIQAPPAAVRSVFLDFQGYKRWSEKWKLEPTEPGKSPSDLKNGDQIQVVMGDMKFKPVIKENTSEALHWLGSLPVIFNGLHQFYFQPSQVNPGGTRFVQIENFSGLLAFLMRPGWSFREKTLTGWNQFNEELKKEVEGRST